MQKHTHKVMDQSRGLATQSSGHTPSQSEQLRRVDRPSSRRRHECIPSTSPKARLVDSPSIHPAAARRRPPAQLTFWCNGTAIPTKVLQFHLSPAEQVQLQRSVAPPASSKRSNIIRTTPARRARNRRSVTFRKRNSPRPLSTFYCPPTPPIPDDASTMPLPEQNYIDAMERWRAQEERLDEYRQKVAMAEKTVEQRRGQRSRRPSFRRAFSLLPDNSGDSALPTPTATATTVPQAAAPAPLSSGRKSFSRKRSSAPAPHAPPPPPPPDTRGPSHYYQDPEARRKLKLYLASPHKFQEAIEYGFPTTPNTTTSTSPQPARNASRRLTAEKSRNRARASRDAQRFLHGNSLSFLDDSSSEDDTDYGANGHDHDNNDYDNDDDDDDDAVSEPELDSPVTPADSEGLRGAMSRHAALGDLGYTSFSTPHRGHDAAVDSPDYVPEFSDVPWPPMREMTMRMTLTRPELRAREEDIYGFADEDPLALQALPAMRDHTALGHRRTESGKVKTLWSKMKKPGKQRR